METNKIILICRNSDEIITTGTFPITSDICQSILHLAKAEADEIQTKTSLGLVKTLAEWKNRVENLKKSLSELQNRNYSGSSRICQNKK